MIFVIYGEAISHQIPKIAVKIMNASTLIDLLGENKLHGKLKKLSEELTDDDNPILVIMKIK